MINRKHQPENLNFIIGAVGIKSQQPVVGSISIMLNFNVDANIVTDVEI
jgi:hypothetical protein